MADKSVPSPMKPSDVKPSNPDNAAEKQASNDAKGDSSGFSKPKWADGLPDPKNTKK